jgi:hypothetical protein
LKASFRPYLMGLTLSLVSALAWAGSLNKTVYDFDDTLMSTTAYIQIFKKGVDPLNAVNPGDMLKISTADWAEVRISIGKEGAFKDYVKNEHSYANFSGAPGSNAFLGHIQDSLKTMGQGSWKAPMWDDFAQNLSSEQAAKDVYILTARGSTAMQVLEGFQFLKEQGQIRNVFPVENIFAVSDPAARLKSDPSVVLSTKPSEESKALVMIDMLDELEAAAKAQPGHTATWAFYDDDYANFAKARDTLVPIASQRWPRVQVTIGYVGDRKEHTPVHEVVVKPLSQMQRIKKASGL